MQIVYQDLLTNATISIVPLEELVPKEEAGVQSALKSLAMLLKDAKTNWKTRPLKLLLNQV